MDDEDSSSGASSMAQMIQAMRGKLKKAPMVKKPDPPKVEEVRPPSSSEENGERFSDDDIDLSSDSEGKERFSDSDIVFSSDDELDVKMSKTQISDEEDNLYANVSGGRSGNSSDDSSDEYEVDEEGLEEYEELPGPKKEENIGVTMSKIGRKVRPVFTEK